MVQPSDLPQKPRFGTFTSISSVTSASPAHPSSLPLRQDPLGSQVISSEHLRSPLLKSTISPRDWEARTGTRSSDVSLLTWGGEIEAKSRDPSKLAKLWCGWSESKIHRPNATGRDIYCRAICTSKPDAGARLTRAQSKSIVPRTVRYENTGQHGQKSRFW